MLLPSLYDKMIAGGLAVALVGSLALNIEQAFDKRDLSTQVAALDKQINDPETGYVTRLGTCRSNVNNLEGGIARQNESIARAAAAQSAALAEATARVAQAQHQADKAIREAETILNTRLKGATVCERLGELDQLLLESVQ